jgi:hypothetical protein
MFPNKIQNLNFAIVESCPTVEEQPSYIEVNSSWRDWEADAPVGFFQNAEVSPAACEARRTKTTDDCCKRKSSSGFNP